MIVYQQRIQNLLNILNSPMFTENNIRNERIVSWYAWNGIFHHTIYQGFGFAGWVFLGSIPIADLLAGKGKHLPMLLWHVYDATKSPAFEITWLHQAIAILLSCVYNIALDTFMTGLINSASCQFELLKWNISMLNKNEKNESKTSKKVSNKLDLELKESVVNNNYDEVYEDLCNCVRHNIAIIEFVAEIENIFSHVISVQLFVNCLIICLITFHLSQMTTFVPADFMGNMLYGCGMAYQIFIYCWNGNELYLQNTSLATFAYMGEWWKFNKRCKSALQIIMVRTCRPLIITDGFLLKLSVTAFLSIIKMSYSLFTLLRGQTETI